MLQRNSVAQAVKFTSRKSNVNKAGDEIGDLGPSDKPLVSQSFSVNNKALVNKRNKYL